jgi:hypothetical protein
LFKRNKSSVLFIDNCYLNFFVFSSLVLSFNQPNFCPTAAWNSNGITFANQSVVGRYPSAIFVNTNNTIYFASQQTQEMLVWYDGSINPSKIIPGNFLVPFSLFVTSNGDIYIGDGEKDNRVQTLLLL